MRIFVTGASGWIGSALIPELVSHGHEVIGLARSDDSAERIEKLGGTVARGDIQDLDVLKKVASEVDGVAHLAFQHDIAFTGRFEEASDNDRKAVDTFGEILEGTGKPLVIASGVIGIAPGKLATEHDGLPDPDGNEAPSRLGTAHAVLALADKNIRSSVMRLAPTVHGEGDNGFMSTLIQIARETGVAGYVGDGSSRWPAIHRSDAAQLFRLALEEGSAGSIYHAVAEEGVTTRDIAEAIGRGLNVPVQSIPEQDVEQHFRFLSRFIGVDSPASSELTQTVLGWKPSGPGLIADLDEGHYFKAQ